jgi:hypothetical protein
MAHRCNSNSSGQSQAQLFHAGSNCLLLLSDPYRLRVCRCLSPSLPLDSFSNNSSDHRELLPLASCLTLSTAPSPLRSPSSDPFSSNASWSFFPPPARTAAEHGVHWKVHYWDTWKLVENVVVG